MKKKRGLKRSIFEYGAGRNLYDYLSEKIQSGWGYAEIIPDMNEIIKKADYSGMIRDKVFNVTQSNLSRWYIQMNFKSPVRKKIREGKKNGNRKG